MVTYSHATTPLHQSERAYYLSYFTSMLHRFPESFVRDRIQLKDVRSVKLKDEEAEIELTESRQYGGNRRGLGRFTGLAAQHRRIFQTHFLSTTPTVFDNFATLAYGN